MAAMMSNEPSLLTAMITFDKLTTYQQCHTCIQCIPHMYTHTVISQVHTANGTCVHMYVRMYSNSTFKGTEIPHLNTAVVCTCTYVQ